jgi:hypothetical protein
MHAKAAAREAAAIREAGNEGTQGSRPRKKQSFGNSTKPQEFSDSLQM